MVCVCVCVCVYVCVRVRVCTRIHTCACVLNIHVVWNDSSPPISLSSIFLPNQINEWKQKNNGTWQITQPTKNGYQHILPVFNLVQLKIYI